MTTILIAEDHALVREGLKLLLSLKPGFEVVAETGDGAAVEQLVREFCPDLLLLDLDLPNCHGAKVAENVRAQSRAVKILVLTGSLQPESVRRALSAGADGYVLKREDSTELTQAIEAVLAGKQYVSKAIAAMFQQQDSERDIDSFEPATPREHEIMCMIARGLSNEEIAVVLNRSALTVRKHRQNLMDKFGLRNAAEITAYAIKHGLADLS
jgi:DNA-binding NarL/FixJ family response regulator